MLRRFRSAITGRYTTPAHAAANPASTVSEHIETHTDLALTFHEGPGCVVVTVHRGGITTGAFEDATYAQALQRLGRSLDQQAGR